MGYNDARGAYAITALGPVQNSPVRGAGEQDMDIDIEQSLLARRRAGRVRVEAEVFDSLSSTNDYLKERALGGAAEGRVAICATQTAGRGRLGRAFFSPPGTGLYLSLLLRPQTLPVADAVLLTPMAAVAVCEAMEELCAVTAQIKWVNDVLVRDKKVCGILTEAAGTPDGASLDWAVIGMGVNIWPPPGGFPPSLPGAGALCAPGTPDLRAPLAAAILDRLLAYYEDFAGGAFLGSYRDRSCVIGRDITVHEGARHYPARATGIDERCRLLVRTAAGEKALDSGEISIGLT